MKGKKFTAAEKHFEKKRIEYERQIKNLNQQLKNAHDDIRLFRSRYELTEMENEELKEWIERLLEYTELSKEDIKLACEKDQRMAKAAEWLNTFSKFMRM